MNRKAILASGFGLLVAASAVRAADFSYTAPGGAIPQIPAGGTTGFANFPLFMNNEVPQITSIELVLTGLTHTQPEDLDIYLISPFGETVEVMTDKGDGVAVVNFNFIFRDSGSPLPADGAALINNSIYQTEDTTGGMNKYIGNSGGTDAWELVIIDDADGDQGFLTSYTLRGTFIPEPATLALLGLGAVAALRRRSKNAS